MADFERIGPYRVLRRLGAGGMGEVVLAHDERLDRLVAIKRLHDDTATPERRERFRREARIVARLDHPAIVQIHDVHHEAGHDYLIMEYVEGETLRAQCATGPMTVSEVLDIAHQIALGMTVAHDRGVIHRDLKAENVLITPAGRAKLTDFGIAKLEGDDTFTADGAVVGTFRAMSPEQALGRPVDHRSDLFSFGILLHEALTGESPFRAETAFLTVQRLVRDDPRPLDELVPSIPDGLAKLVHQLLAKEPLLRPRDFHEVADALIELAAQAGDAPCRAGSSHGGLLPAGEDTRSTEHSATSPRPLPNTAAPDPPPPDAAAPDPPPTPAAPDPPLPDAAAMPGPGNPSSGSRERPAVLDSRNHILGAAIRTRPHRRRWRVAALGAAALAALGFAYALGGGDGPDDARRNRDWRAVWCAVDIGTSHSVQAIWGSAPDDVYLVGRETMLHYDGAAWKAMEPPKMSPRSVAHLYEIWGSGAKDIYVIGEDSVWEDNQHYKLTSVIWHYDGFHWQPIQPEFSRTIDRQTVSRVSFSVWGSASNDVFVLMRVSNQFSAVLHYDGISWNRMVTGSERSLAAIWGNNRADVFAVGYEGTILHYNGIKWQSMNAGITGNLLAVRGSSSNDVYAVGDSGLVLHYDGIHWQSIDTEIGTSTVGSIWGSGSHDVFITGGAMMHYDGVSWRPVKLQTQSQLWRVWGNDPSNIYLIDFDSALKYYNGQPCNS